MTRNEIRDIVEGNVRRMLLENKQMPFDFDHLKELFGNYRSQRCHDVIPKAIEYCTQVFGESIGEGLGRIVFQIDDTRVFKLARSRHGIEQNKVEYEEYQKHKQSPLFPIVYGDSDTENFFFLVSEYVLPIDNDDLKNLYGTGRFMSDFYMPMKQMEELIKNQNHRGAIELLDEKWEQNPKLANFLEEVFCYLNKGGTFYDLRLDNLGMAIRNGDTQIVLLDTGI